MIAVHLSNNQRFAEAQKWFHLVFDPTSTDRPCRRPSASGSPSCSGNGPGIQNINTLLALLSTPDAQLGAGADPGQDGRHHRLQRDPGQPVRAARRGPHPAERLPVVRRDEVPGQPDRLGRQPVPGRHHRDAQRGHALLRAGRQHPRAAAAGHAAARRPPARRTSCSSSRRAWTRCPTRWSTWRPSSRSTSCPARPPPEATAGDQSGALFGIGRSLYFCIPQNQNLLAYWDTVADRLFKIRNSENIQGVVAAAAAVRPAARSRHARQGRRGRHRHRQHRQRPEPAARPGPLACC